MCLIYGNIYPNIYKSLNDIIEIKLQYWTDADFLSGVTGAVSMQTLNFIPPGKRQTDNRRLLIYRL